jgi:hypothetical protein
MLTIMLIPFFYTLNLLLLLSGLLGIRLFSGERKFSLALVQTLLGLPLLAAEYLYLSYHLGAGSSASAFFRNCLCPYMALHGPAVAQCNDCNRG